MKLFHADVENVALVIQYLEFTVLEFFAKRSVVFRKALDTITHGID